MFKTITCKPVAISRVIYARLGVSWSDGKVGKQLAEFVVEHSSSIEQDAEEEDWTEKESREAEAPTEGDQSCQGTN